MVRVLLVDDSATARALVGAILRSDPGIQVVGEARDGEQGVEMTKTLQPNLVLMDFQMPNLDGFEATRRIMAEAPTPIVVMSGTLDTRDVMVSMDAMRAGALAVVAKPPAPNAPEFERECRYILSTIKAMAQVRTVRRIQSLALGDPLPQKPRQAPTSDKRRLVALAASTGGPAALYKILTELPKTFPTPILAVQHIAIGFADGLASWLDKACQLRVKVGVHGEPLQAGTVYLSPDNRHIGVSAAETVVINDGPPIGGFRPSASFLFETAAKHMGASVVGAILTGMGEDGVAGLRQLHEAGGLVLAQDEESSVVFGMPRAAINAGVADQILPLTMVASRLRELV